MDCSGAGGRDRGDREDLPENSCRTQPADPAQGGRVLHADTGSSAGDSHNRRRAGDQRGAGGPGAGRDPARGTGARGECASAAHATRGRRATRGDRTGSGGATHGGGATRSDRTGAAHATGGRRAARGGCTTGSRRAARGSCTTGSRRAARGSRTTRGDRAGPTQRGAKHPGLELTRQHHRQNQRQRGALTPDLPLEGCAAGAAVDVGARNTPGQHAAAHRRQPLADLGARVLPRAPPPGQPLARLEYQRLDLLFAHPEHGCDFLVRMIRELEQNECGALIVGQPLQVIEHLSEVLAPLDHVYDTLARWSISRHTVDLDIPASAELRQAAVTGDRVQPGAEQHVAVAPSQ